MRRRLNHSLKIWLLALALGVVLAPMQSVLAAIDMLEVSDYQTQHCQHDMAGQMDNGGLQHGDCCQSDEGCGDHCAACTQSISVYGMLVGYLQPEHLLKQQFLYPIHTTAIGLTPSGDYRPPRSLS